VFILKAGNIQGKSWSLSGGRLSSMTNRKDRVPEPFSTPCFLPRNLTTVLRESNLFALLSVASP
jgi:hypothetical protein